MYSAKELEHYERVRKTFDSSGDSRKETIEPPANPPASRRSLLPTRPKLRDRAASKGKGKGKAPARDWAAFEADDEPGDDEDESAGNGRLTSTGPKSVNGWTKGKATTRNPGPGGFGDPSENDEEELYA